MLATRLRTLSFFTKPVRMYSHFDYSAIEEPSLKLEDGQVNSDNNLFQIVHKSNTLKDLVKFYTKESATLSLLHHSIFLNKVASVAKKHEGDEDDLVMAEKVMRRSAAYLFEHSKNLDPHSVAQTLKVLAYDQNSKLDLKFKPTFGQLA
jgi:hypothetical protein